MKRYPNQGGKLELNSTVKETCPKQKNKALLSITLSWSAIFATKILSYDSEIGSQDIITSVKKPLLTIYPSGLPLRQPEKQ